MTSPFCDALVGNDVRPTIEAPKNFDAVSLVKINGHADIDTHIFGRTHLKQT